jgi:hypothetical protein
MKYQLVLQWPAISETDFDRLTSLEELIEDGLRDVGILDGHDFGSGEMNVFVHTDKPKAAFEKIKSLLAAGENIRELKAGYRDFKEDNYTAIYPEGLKKFSII